MQIAELNNYICRDGDLVLVADLEGFHHGRKFDVKDQGISMYELLDGMVWPVGATLSLPSDAERPGSVVVTIKMPIGGKTLSRCGPSFSAFAVSLS